MQLVESSRPALYQTMTDYWNFLRGMWSGNIQYIAGITAGTIEAYDIVTAKQYHFTGGTYLYQTDSDKSFNVSLSDGRKWQFDAASMKLYKYTGGTWTALTS